MADHSELVSEMTLLEKMSTQDRLKLARKRRMQQLKKWNQKEKEYASKSRKNKEPNNTIITNINTTTTTINGRKGSAPSNNVMTSTTTSKLSKGLIRDKNKKKDIHYKVHFVPSVMLLEAAARNDIDEVRRLLMLSVSPDSTNEDGLTALHQCCIDDSEEMMKLLIDFGANVNAKDSEQWTPLHAAATCGHLHLVKYLIGKGADLLAVNADGNMPYDICEDEGTLDYIESEMASRGVTQEMIDETRAWTENQMLQDLKNILTKDGNTSSSHDLEFRDLNGATPLHIASANGYLSVVEYLLDNHVSTDVVDNDLWQPVHAAACWGHPDVLELLVQSGADLEAKTKNGETPLDICEDVELKERIQQLKSEMETKRNNSKEHSNRLKRSHSSNTRTQSVRRTSIREKSQISRREAKLEAKMRSQGTTTAVDTSTTTTSSSAVNDNTCSVLDTLGRTSTMPDLVKSTNKQFIDSTKSKSVVDVNGSSSALKDNNIHQTRSEKDLQKMRNENVLIVSNVRTSFGEKENSTKSKQKMMINDDVIKNPGYSDQDVKQQLINQNNSDNNSSKVVNNINTEEADDNLLNNVSKRGSNDSTSSSGVKVEIHVTVNTNGKISPPTAPSGINNINHGHQPSIISSATSTLADLKKMRRSSNSLINSNCDVVDGNCQENGVDVPTTTNGNNSGTTIRCVVDGGTISRRTSQVLIPPPSPSRPNIFRGDPSEVVGGKSYGSDGYHKQGCCVIS